MHMLRAAAMAAFPFRTSAGLAEPISMLLSTSPDSCFDGAADAPSYREDEDFWVVTREPGSVRRDLPIFAARPGAVQLRATAFDEPPPPSAPEPAPSPDTSAPPAPLTASASPPRVPVTRTDVSGGIGGAFVLHDVLDARECAQVGR